MMRNRGIYHRVLSYERQSEKAQVDGSIFYLPFIFYVFVFCEQISFDQQYDATLVTRQ